MMDGKLCLHHSPIAAGVGNVNPELVNPDSLWPVDRRALIKVRNYWVGKMRGFGSWCQQTSDTRDLCKEPAPSLWPEPSCITIHSTLFIECCLHVKGMPSSGCPLGTCAPFPIQGVELPLPPRLWVSFITHLCLSPLPENKMVIVLTSRVNQIKTVMCHQHLLTLLSFQTL